MIKPSPVHIVHNENADHEHHVLNVEHPSNSETGTEAPSFETALFAQMACVEVGELRMSPDQTIRGRTLPSTTMVLTSQGETRSVTMPNLAAAIRLGGEDTLAIKLDADDPDGNPLAIEMTLSVSEFIAVMACLPETPKPFADDDDQNRPKGFRFEVNEFEGFGDRLAGYIASASAISVPPANDVVSP